MRKRVREGEASGGDGGWLNGCLSASSQVLHVVNRGLQCEVEEMLIDRSGQICVSAYAGFFFFCRVEVRPAGRDVDVLILEGPGPFELFATMPPQLRLRLLPRCPRHGPIPCSCCYFSMLGSMLKSFGDEFSVPIASFPCRFIRDMQDPRIAWDLGPVGLVFKLGERQFYLGSNSDRLPFAKRLFGPFSLLPGDDERSITDTIGGNSCRYDFSVTCATFDRGGSGGLVPNPQYAAAVKAQQPRCYGCGAAMTLVGQCGGCGKSLCGGCVRECPSCHRSGWCDTCLVGVPCSNSAARICLSCLEGTHVETLGKT